jgi:hypothetical protein
MEQHYNDGIYEQFEEDIHDMWMRKIIGDFSIQRSIASRNLGFSTGHLELPNFAISKTQKQWGSWHHSTRTLSLSKGWMTMDMFMVNYSIRRLRL